MKWGFKPAAAGPPKNDRLRRLAKRLDALARKDEGLLRRAQEIERLRRRAALELYEILSGFAAELNALLVDTTLEFDPEQYRLEDFRDGGANLFQINARGRILEIEFKATDELTATENFRVPYTLEGAVRSFNQQLLDRETIVEHGLFYTLEKTRNLWRFFDARTYRTGPVDTGYLISVMEELV